MIKNKFSFVLTALAVALMIPGTAFAAEEAQSSTAGAEKSISVSSISSVEKTSTTDKEGTEGSPSEGGVADSSTEGKTEGSSTEVETESGGIKGTESNISSEEKPSTAEQEKVEGSSVDGEAESSQQTTEGTEIPSTPLGESSLEGSSPEDLTVPEADSEAPVVSMPEEGAEIDPGFSVEAGILTDDVETEIPAIPEVPVVPEVIEEEATLIIHHLFEAEGIVCDDYETVEGLIAGDSIRFNNYSYENEHEFAECLNGKEAMELHAGENSIVIKYTLKDGYRIK